MTTVETERLTLRGWRDDDLDALAALDADPEVMRYLLDGSVHEFDTVVPGHGQPVAVHAITSRR